MDLEPLLRLEALPALLAVERPPAVRPHVQLQPEGGVARPEADGALVLLREVDEARVPSLGLGILEHLFTILQKERGYISTHIIRVSCSYHIMPVAELVDGMS